VGHAGFEDVEGGAAHDFEGERAVRGAVGDAQGRLVEHHLGVADQRVHPRLIANVALDQVDAAALERAGKVGRPAADHVVDDRDLGRVVGEKLSTICDPTKPAPPVTRTRLPASVLG